VWAATCLGNADTSELGSTLSANAPVGVEHNLDLAVAFISTNGAQDLVVKASNDLGAIGVCLDGALGVLQAAVAGLLEDLGLEVRDPVLDTVVNDTGIGVTTAERHLEFRVKVLRVGFSGDRRRVR